MFLAGCGRLWGVVLFTVYIYMSMRLVVLVPVKVVIVFFAAFFSVGFNRTGH